MSFLDDWEGHFGRIVGRLHLGTGNLLTGDPVQDGIGYACTPGCIVSDVFDGCTDKQYSHFGAVAAGEIVPAAIVEAQSAGRLCLSGDQEQVSGSWEAVRQGILARLAALAEIISGSPPLSSDYERIVREYMMFTIMGVIITPKLTAVFGIGDGYWAVNGELFRVGEPKDPPPYLSYSLLSGYESVEDAFRFRLHRVIPTAELQSVFVSTDGLEWMIKKQGVNVPGKVRLVGHVSQFWLNDELFLPIASLRDAETGRIVETATPLLRQFNSEVVKMGKTPEGERIIQRQTGVFRDDFSEVTLRRRKDVKNATTDLA
jgi:hypothetical protein